MTPQKFVAKKVDRWTVDQMSGLFALFSNPILKSTAKFLEENQRKNNKTADEKTPTPYIQELIIQMTFRNVVQYNCKTRN